MSVVISTPQQICNNPLNRSKTKSLYSFPKSERFKMQKNYYCDQFYDLPSTKSKRVCNLGYSTKYDFTKDQGKTPAPNVYTIPSDIDRYRQKKTGISFGESREVTFQQQKIVHGTIFPKFNDFVPGPGLYKTYSTLNGLKYSMHDRTKDLSQKPNNVPGPGHYKHYASINEKGKYIVSKYQSSLASNFNPQHSQRFNDSKFFYQEQYINNVPGPGSYQAENSLSNDGSYFLSKFENSKVRSFSHQPKDQVHGGIYQQTKVPGPGSYRLQSDFGWYEAKQKNTNI